MVRSARPKPIVRYRINWNRVRGPHIEALRQAVATMIGCEYTLRDLHSHLHEVRGKRGPQWQATEAEWAHAVTIEIKAQHEHWEKVQAAAVPMLARLDEPIPVEVIGSIIAAVAKAKTEYESRKFDFFPRRRFYGWHQRRRLRGTQRWQKATDWFCGVDWLDQFPADEHGNAIDDSDSMTSENCVPFTTYRERLEGEIKSLVEGYMLQGIDDKEIRYEVLWLPAFGSFEGIVWGLCETHLK